MQFYLNNSKDIAKNEVSIYVLVGVSCARVPTPPTDLRSTTRLSAEQKKRANFSGSPVCLLCQIPRVDRLELSAQADLEGTSQRAADTWIVAHFLT